MCFVDSLDIDACIKDMSAALNKSLVVRRLERSDAIKIRDGFNLPFLHVIEYVVK